MFDIGKIISELRKERGWTQVELASKLGVSDKAVSKWENGGGFPDITQLPVLASIFNVSIDYLMTGKKEENISLDDMDDYKRQLYLIQKDDVENYVKYGYHLKTDFYNFGDENNPKPIDAIIRNCSKKIFNACVDAKTTFYIKQEAFYRHVDELVKMACVSGSVLFLDLIQFRLYAVGDKTEQLKSNGSCKVYHNNFRHTYEAKTTYLISNDTLSFIFNNKDIPCNIIEYISTYIPFDITSVSYGTAAFNYGQIERGDFYFLEQDIIKQLYLTKRFDLLTKFMEYAQADCFNTIDKFNDTRSHHRSVDYRISSGYLIRDDKSEYGIAHVLGKLISINEDIISLAISNGDCLWAKKFVSFNKTIKDNIGLRIYNPYILSVEEIQNLIRIEEKRKKILNDASISEHERKLKLLETECFIDNILDIEKTIKANDYKFAERMINNSYIHVVELVYKYLEENNWDKIFEFAETYKIDYVKCAVQEQRFDIAKSKLIEAVWVEDTKKPVWNSLVSKEMHELRDINNEILGLSSLGYISYNEGFATFEYAINYLKTKRIEILNNLKQKIGYQSIKDELNINYFDSLLSNGLYEVVIIKLCVLLESILKADFHYEGELIEILEKYCLDNINDDDLSSLLHKLRKCRNNIVHPEQNGESISKDELKECIDYICALADKQ